MLLSDCCWKKDNPDQCGCKLFTNNQVRKKLPQICVESYDYGLGPKKGTRKKYSEHPLLLCIEIKILETSKLSIHFAKQNNSTSN